MSSITQRDLVAGLKERYQQLSEQLEATANALRGFGVDPDNMRMAPRRASRTPRRAERRPTRSLDPSAVEAEVIRILEEIGEPAYVEEIFTYPGSDFGEHTPSAIYHAERRHPDITRVDGGVGPSGRPRIRIALREWGNA